MLLSLCRPADWSDDLLLGVLDGGQLWALAELLTRYGPHVQAHARRLGLPDPAGAAQEAFIRIARDAACARPSPLAGRDWLLLHAGRTLSALATRTEPQTALENLPAPLS